MRVIIVDDEELSLKRLKRILSENSGIDVCGTFMNPLEALAYARTNPVDAAFLDISMPDMGGMRLSGELRSLNASTAIILVTGYDEYAVQAFDMDVIDYVIKPVTAERLHRTIERIRKHLGSSQLLPPAQLSIRLFDGLAVYAGEADGTPIKLRSPKTEEMLALLVCKKSISREELADTLWGDLSPDKALNNINSTLYYIRRAFGDRGFPSVVMTDRNGVRIDASAVDCDLYAFEHMLQQMRQSSAHCTELFMGMDSLYKGELLKGRSYEWASDWTRRLEYDYIEMLETAARYHIARSEQIRALYYFERILQLDGIREDIHREVIMLYLSMGRNAEAHRQFHLLEKLLHQEIGSTPDPNIRNLLNKY